LVGAGLAVSESETCVSSRQPLEREFSTIAGIQSMSSTNSQGSTQITVQFTLDRSIDAAAQDIQAAISKAGGNLPPSMPRPPLTRRRTPRAAGALHGADSSTLPLYNRGRIRGNTARPAHLDASGVSARAGLRRAEYAVRVQVNPDAMTARGIGIDEVQRAIQQSNVNLPVGKLYGEKQGLHGSSRAAS